MHSKTLHMLSFLLVMVGAANWGLIGLFQFNLVDALFGAAPIVVTVTYVLVGLSAIYLSITHSKNCNVCEVKMPQRKVSRHPAKKKKSRKK